MSKSKSQWDFGELFPTEQLRKVLSVSELTAQVQRLLEKSVGLIWVGGEVSNLRAQTSGHIYFTLKDAGAQLSCVCFRDDARESRALLADGQQVVLQGDVTVYEVRGQYQLVVREIELRGVGALQIAFEKLKLKLAAEGLFAPERKRLLPKYPQRIGLVTSSDWSGDSRRAARRATAESEFGNHPRAMSRARRRRGEGNCGGDSLAK